MQWEKKCKSLKSEAASFGQGSWELPLGPSNDIHNENFENMNNFETNTIHHINSNVPNGVMPLQCHTNESQISSSGCPSVASSGTSLHLVTSSLPADMCSGASLWNSNYVMGMQIISSHVPPQLVLLVCLMVFVSPLMPETLMLVLCYLLCTCNYLVKQNSLSNSTNCAGNVYLSRGVSLVIYTLSCWSSVMLIVF